MNNRPGPAAAAQQQQQQQQQSLRTVNMNAYGPPPGARHTPRLQNTQKTSLGNGGGGWGALGGLQGGGAFGGGLGGTGAPGLVQARPGHLAGFAQVMGGGGGQGAIDMSDFPSLSGGPRPQQNNVTASASWNSSAIRQAPPPQSTQQTAAQHRAPSTAPSQQSLDQFDGQRSQQSSGDRARGGDDFPPLGGPVNSDAHGFSSGMGSPDLQPNGQQTQLPIRQSSGAFSSNTQVPVGQQPSQNGQAAPSSTSSVKRYADMTEEEKWGLPGLVAVFEARKQAENGGQVDETLPPLMRSPLAMGQDLNELGLHLESPDFLHPTFTPFPNPKPKNSDCFFDFHDRHMVPDFTLPSAYTVTNVPPLSSRMSAFSDETLFSIFYQMPHDVMQELAAQELAARDWRWHKTVRQWLQKDTRESAAASSLQLADTAPNAPVGTPPVRTGERSERGVYVFFDPWNWRRVRKEFFLDYDQLDVQRQGGMGVSIGGALGAGAASAVPVQQRTGVGSSQIPGA